MDDLRINPKKLRLYVVFSHSLSHHRDPGAIIATGMVEINFTVQTISDVRKVEKEITGQLCSGHGFVDWLNAPSNITES